MLWHRLQLLWKKTNTFAIMRLGPIPALHVSPVKSCTRVLTSSAILKLLSCHWCLYDKPSHYQHDQVNMSDAYFFRGHIPDRALFCDVQVCLIQAPCKKLRIVVTKYCCNSPPPCIQPSKWSKMTFWLLHQGIPSWHSLQSIYNTLTDLLTIKSVSLKIRANKNQVRA